MEKIKQESLEMFMLKRKILTFSLNKMESLAIVL